MDQSKEKMSISQRGSSFDSKGGENEDEVTNMGRNKGGMMDLGGGQANIG